MSARVWAGAARRDVTPAVPVSLAGHASRTTSAPSVASPLAVRLLVLDDRSTRLVLAVADALWWPPEAASAIRARVAARLGTTPACVWLHATHTHSAPQTSDHFAPTLGEFRPEFTDALEAAVTDAGAEAIAALTGVTLQLGEDCERIGVHRRRPTPDGVSMAPNDDVPVDDRVRVARLTSAVGVVATVVHHACHPTTTGENAVSSDWPGAMARDLDADGGVTLFLQGCAGDTRPDLRSAPDRFRLGDEAEAVILGRRIAAAARRGLADPRPAAWRELEVEAGAVDVHLEDGSALSLTVVGAHLAEGWRLVGLACEPVMRYQRAAPEAWVCGYTNGMLGYLPTAAQRIEGGYEPIGSLKHFRLSEPFDADTEPAVVAEVQRLAGAEDEASRGGRDDRLLGQSVVRDRLSP